MTITVLCLEILVVYLVNCHDEEHVRPRAVLVHIGHVARSVLVRLVDYFENVILVLHVDLSHVVEVDTLDGGLPYF